MTKTKDLSKFTVNTGEKSFSLLKRILHYTRWIMTESRLNDLALRALHPIRLSELSTEKIIEMFVQVQIPENCSTKELVNI